MKLSRLDRIERGIEALHQKNLETAAIVKVVSEQQKKTDEQLAKTDAQLAKTDAQLAKTDAQLARTDKKLAKTVAQLARTDKKLEKTSEQLARTDAQLARTDVQLAKTDFQLGKNDAQLSNNDGRLKETARMMKEFFEGLAETKRVLSGMGINVGDAAEDFFIHSLQDHKRLGDIQFETSAREVTSHKGRIQDEFDLVLYNGNSIGLVEINHKVHPSDLEKLISSKLPNFRYLFPQYNDYRIYLGLAGMSFPKGVAEMAEKKGVAVLRQKGNVLFMNQNLRAF